MKIDAHVNPAAAEKVDRVGGSATSTVDQGATVPATVEDLRLSSDAPLRPTAMQTAQDPPGIRTELVERMRAALASGTVGDDPDALAKAILDRLIGASSQKLR